MNEILEIIMVIFVGTALGAVFFGGLRWTVSKGLISPHPAIWFSSSFILRFAITISGFYFIAHEHYGHLLQSLCAFALVSFATCWLDRRSEQILVRVTED